jgi:copper(I)-binding protein
MSLRPLLVATILLLTVSAAAQEQRVGPLLIERPWIRETPKGASIAAGYLKITNHGQSADRLVGGTTAAAARVEVHEMSMQQGVMKMRPLQAGLEIKPGAAVELTPGGLHIMLVGIKERLTPGQRVRVTLSFEKAGAADVEFDVLAMGAKPAHGANREQRH